MKLQLLNKAADAGPAAVAALRQVQTRAHRELLNEQR